MTCVTVVVHVTIVSSYVININIIVVNAIVVIIIAIIAIIIESVPASFNSFMSSKLDHFA